MVRQKNQGGDGFDSPLQGSRGQDTEIQGGPVGRKFFFWGLSRFQTRWKQELFPGFVLGNPAGFASVEVLGADLFSWRWKYGEP